MSEDTPKSRLELSVDLVKALAWPILALFLLIAFWVPLREIAYEFPKVMSKSETITIAGVSIKIRGSFKQQPSAAVAEILAVLTPDGVQKLVDRGNAWHYSDARLKDEVSELVRLKLLEEIPFNEMSPQDQKAKNYGVRPTALGEEARSFLLTLLSQFAEDLKRAEP